MYTAVASCDVVNILGEIIPKISHTAVRQVSTRPMLQPVIYVLSVLCIIWYIYSCFFVGKFNFVAEGVL